jgi:photosystem II stability/assembly factor-like uncharacterized protein
VPFLRTVATVADALATVADALATVADALATVADALAKAADAVAKAADALVKAADALAKAADAVAKAADAVAKAADAVAKAADALATAADALAKAADGLVPGGNESRPQSGTPRNKRSAGRGMTAQGPNTAARMQHSRAQRLNHLQSEMEPRRIRNKPFIHIRRGGGQVCVNSKKFFPMRAMILAGILVAGSSVNAQNKVVEYDIKPSHFPGLQWRNIGPAVTAGRISDIAVNDRKPGEYFLAIASGGVFRTRNWGNTYEPVFDHYGSYSVGCLTIDPHNPSRIWLGSGENNNQRSVGYGDGVYVSDDGGTSWRNVGLPESEHIHKIVVHPDSANVVYVASAGPLWRDGGERGVYKTSDGGKTWKRILHISDMTGVSDLVMDPRNPKVMYAAAHQRRRHVWTYIGGGPESGIYKTTDGGKTWEKANSGLPAVDLGRIGLAISPADPEVLYAIVEAAQGKGGFYRTTNRAASWEKRSGFNTSGNYYQEIVCHPTNKDVVFAMDTWLHHTEDGGATFKMTGEKSKHVDNHCMWIDPANTNHWLVGCDGGLYETWDAAANWQYKPNLPITQFYKVTVDNARPFYYVYGGTQDNNSLGGPSRTINNAGILNSDWFITNGGDGFESAVDPDDPNIVYAQAQYGWLVRYDKKSGETTPIQPQPGKDEEAFRWNWDAPLLVSPHNSKRLYFAANRVLRSDDRGDSWKAVSDDLTRGIDRNRLPVMGRVWSVDAVMKNQSTTIYGNITALDESPVTEGLLYAGTDDGLIHVSENGGGRWNRIGSFTGVPENTYVNQIVASQHDANTVFAVFNNHKNGDFKPYLLKSTNQGRSWTLISGDLPLRGTVYTFAEDHVNKDLLFCGTEFGFYFSVNGGKNWVKLGNGLPNIAVKDIAIQRRENDLVIATFGRGFYVLDDYTSLRMIEPSTLKKEAIIFPIKPALAYIESAPLGLTGVGSQGESFYAAPNPPLGAVFTYYLKESIKTLQQQRRDEEAERQKKGEGNPYPSIEDLRAEDRESEPFLLFVVSDAVGRPVRTIKAPASAGVQRVVWNFRSATTTPVQLRDAEAGRYEMADDGYMLVPGEYQVMLYKSVNGELTLLVPAQKFVVESLNHQSLPAADKKALEVFLADVSELRRRVRGAGDLSAETKKRLDYIRAAIQKYPLVPVELMTKVKEYDELLYQFNTAMWGDRTLSSREFETKDGLASRIELIVWTQWHSSSAPTQTSRNGYQIAREQFDEVVKKLHAAVAGVEDLEKRLDSYGAPYTPGRDANWKED